MAVLCLIWHDFCFKHKHIKPFKNMKFKKEDILPVLLTMAVYPDDKSTEPAKGLLSMTMSLGLRRRIQKIRNAMLEKQKELQADLKEIQDELKKKQEELEASGVAKEEAESQINAEMVKEINELTSEEFELDLEYADIKMIEAIDTKENLDWNIIEKFAK